MHVIAKMTCQSVVDYGSSRKISFSCVHDSKLNIGAKPENVAFTNATPNGEAWMTVDNKNVWPVFNNSRWNQDDPSENRNASQHYVVFISADKFSLEEVQAALSTLEEKDETPAAE